MTRCWLQASRSDRQLSKSAGQGTFVGLKVVLETINEKLAGIEGELAEEGMADVDEFFGKPSSRGNAACFGLRRAASRASSSPKAAWGVLPPFKGRFLSYTPYGRPRKQTIVRWIPLTKIRRCITKIGCSNSVFGYKSGLQSGSLTCKMLCKVARRARLATVDKSRLERAVN